MVLTLLLAWFSWLGLVWFDLRSVRLGWLRLGEYRLGQGGSDLCRLG